MSTCTTRKPLLAVTVPQPLARSVELGTAPVVNLSVAPPPEALGGYVAVCAGEYDEGIAHWMDVHGGIRPFAPEDVHTGTVLAVARVAAVSQWPDVPRESRWYVGPVGLWLADVIRLPELVPVEPGPVAQCWELPEDVRAAVRAGYKAARDATKALWDDFSARSAKALEREPAPTLKDKLLRLCSCRRAMTPCPSCKAFRCLNPDCGPHACHQEAHP